MRVDRNDGRAKKAFFFSPVGMVTADDATVIPNNAAIELIEI